MDTQLESLWTKLIPDLILPKQCQNLFTPLAYGYEGLENIDAFDHQAALGNCAHQRNMVMHHVQLLLLLRFMFRSVVTG